MTYDASVKKSSIVPDRAVAIEQIRRLAEHARRVLVVSHIDPDGDALGSQLAMSAYLKALGKEVFLVRDSEIPDKYRFLPGSEAIRPTLDLPKDFTVDTAIILECPSPERVGSAMRYIGEDMTVINIDHHPDAQDLGTVNWIETAASSVGEMLYEYFTTVGAVITADMATALYAAILTDTGRFRYPSTSARTMTIAGALIDAGADPQAICDHVYYNMPLSTLHLHGRVLNAITFHNNDRICILAMTRGMLTDSGAEESEADGIVDYALYGTGVRAGAFFKEVSPTVTKVSMRSRGAVDVSSVAAQFGGGGHRNAAGCRVDGDIASAQAEILDLLREAIDDTH
jgi:phosphoesterase RecJ-like protein